MADVKYMVTVDATGAVKEIQTLDKAWEKVQKTAPATSSVMGQLGGALKSVAGQFTIATLAAKAIESTISGVKDFFSSAIQGAIEEEQANLRLRTSLDMSRGARVSGMRDLKSFAEEQSRVTIYTHEEVESTMALLASMTELDNEGLKKVTKGVIGLSATLGPNEGGLGGATMRVMRAIEGNAAGLKRVGIEIDDTLPKGEQLAQLQEKLANLYPKATAELDTTGGSIKNLKKEWDELKEEVGANILEMIDAGGNIDNLTKFLRKQRDNTVELADKISYATVKSEMFRSAMSANYGGDMPMEKVLATIKRDLPEINTSYAALMETFLKGPEAFNKFMDTLRGVNDIIAASKDAFKEGRSGAFDLTQAFKDLGIKSGTELQAKLKLAKDALAEYQKTAHPLPGVIDQFNKKIEELTLAIKGPKDPIELVRKGIHSLKVEMKDSEEEFKKWKEQWLESLVASQDLPEPDWDKILEEWLPPTIEVPPFLTPIIEETERMSQAAQIMAGKTRASFESISKTSLNSELVALKTKFDEMAKSGDYTAQEMDKVAKSIKRVEAELKDTPKWVVQMKNAIGSLAPYVEAVFAGMDAIFSQAQKNKEIAIENEYKKRLDVINNTVKDEGEKQKAIVALEAEFEIKRTEARRAGAKQQKAVAIAEAIWNTYRAVTEVLPNFVLAAIVAAFGAVQIGMIAKQPIPLARGAVFNKRTRMTDEMGTTFEMGEAGPEYLIPEKHLTPLLGGGRRGPSGLVPQFAGASHSTTVNIHSPLVSTVGLSQADLEAAGHKLFGIIERQMRLRGRT